MAVGAGCAGVQDRLTRLQFGKRILARTRWRDWYVGLEVHFNAPTVNEVHILPRIVHTGHTVDHNDGVVLQIVDKLDKAWTMILGSVDPRETQWPCGFAAFVDKVDYLLS